MAESFNIKPNRLGHDRRLARARRIKSVTETDAGIYLKGRFARFLFRIMSRALRQTDALFRNLWDGLQAQRCETEKQRDRVGNLKNWLGDLYRRLGEKEKQILRLDAEARKLRAELSTVRHRLRGQAHRCSELQRSCNKAILQAKTLSAQYLQYRERTQVREAQYEKMADMISGIRKIVGADRNVISGKNEPTRLKKENTMLYEKLRQVDRGLAQLA